MHVDALAAVILLDAHIAVRALLNVATARPLRVLLVDDFVAPQTVVPRLRAREANLGTALGARQARRRRRADHVIVASGEKNKSNLMK